MKKYTSLGELLTDYRNLTKISQQEFAAILNVDARSVLRWEKDETLIKPEKEKEIVEKTLIPYQVVRNLNAAVPIPVYFDYRMRKYSNSKLTKELPAADWFKTHISIETPRRRTIQKESDLDDIIRYTSFLYRPTKPIKKQLILEAAKLLPELNQIIFDGSGYYAGHSVAFPISMVTFEKLRNREITEYDIAVTDLIDYRNVEKPVFWNYDITGDSNENIFYIICPLLKFFTDIQSTDYTFAAYTIRYDNYKFVEEFGLTVAWEDLNRQKELDLEEPPRFYEGNFTKFLNEE